MRDTPRERMMGRSPRWVETLLSLRNALVAPFGLKTSGAGEHAAGGLIGIFPVLSETPDRLVAGFNDHHLDFRVVVDVATSGQRPAGDRDHAGADAQLARPGLSRDHPAVSPADRPRPAAAGRGLSRDASAVRMDALSSPVLCSRQRINVPGDS